MKVGVVGLGYWGPQLVRNLTFLERTTQVVACDVDEARVKAVVRQYPSVIPTTDFNSVVEDPEVAAVVVATPVKTHVDLATRALEGGKSVLVEKPLATTTTAARHLVQLAAERSLLVMAGHTFLYSPAVREVKRLLEEGELGTPLYVQSSRVNLGIHQSDVSVITDLAPHDLSILLYWLDEPPVQVSATGRSSHGIGPADVAFIDVSFASGCIANLHLSWLAPTKVRRTTLVGSKRMVIYEDTNYEEPIKLYDKGVSLPDPTDFGEFKATYRAGDVVSPRIEVWEPLRAELEDFLKRVAAGDTPGDQENAALSVVATVEAAEQSLARNGVVLDL